MNSDGQVAYFGSADSDNAQNQKFADSSQLSNVAYV